MIILIFINRRQLKRVAQANYISIVTKQNIHQFFWSHGNLIDYNHIVFNKRLLLSIKTTGWKRETIIQKTMQRNSILIAFLRKDLCGFTCIGSITNLAGFYLQGFDNKFYQSRLTSTSITSNCSITFSITMTLYCNLQSLFLLRGKNHNYFSSWSCACTSCSKALQKCIFI